MPGMVLKWPIVCDEAGMVLKWPMVRVERVVLVEAGSGSVDGSLEGSSVPLPALLVPLLALLVLPALLVLVVLVALPAVPLELVLSALVLLVAQV